MGGDIEEPAAGDSLQDGGFERGFGHVEQTLGLRTGSADRIGHGAVGVKTVENHAAVDRENVAVFEDGLLAGHAVHHLVIERGAKRCRKAVVPLECGFGAEGIDLAIGGDLEIHRGRAGDDHRAKQFVDLAQLVSRAPHLIDLGWRLDHDRHPVKLPAAAVEVARGWPR